MVNKYMLPIAAAANSAFVSCDLNSAAAAATTSMLGIQGQMSLPFQHPFHASANQMSLCASTNQMPLVPYGDSSVMGHRENNLVCYATASATSAAMYPGGTFFPTASQLVPFEKQLQLQTQHQNHYANLNPVINEEVGAAMTMEDANNVLSEDSMGNLVYHETGSGNICEQEGYPPRNGSESPNSTSGAVILSVPQIIKKGQGPSRNHRCTNI